MTKGGLTPFLITGYKQLPDTKEDRPLPTVPQAYTTLEEATADWRRVVIGAQPTANADYVRTVCEEIVRRAEVISREAPVAFPEVAGFLLMRTRAWVLGGLPVTKIGAKLPKNLSDLGMLKLAEGGRDGGPLSEAELKQAMQRPILRTIQ